MVGRVSPIRRRLKNLLKGKWARVHQIIPWPCILSRINANEGLGLKTSIRDGYDTNCIIYRCFLPDLTGFITVCCVPSNPDLRKRAPRCRYNPEKEILPRMSGFRVQGTASSPLSTAKKNYTSTRSFNSLPTLKKGSLFLETLIMDPVLGFLPL